MFLTTLGTREYLFRAKHVEMIGSLLGAHSMVTSTHRPLSILISTGSAVTDATWVEISSTLWPTVKTLMSEEPYDG